MKILASILMIAFATTASAQNISHFSLSCRRCPDAQRMDCSSPGIDLKGEVSVAGNRAQLVVQELYLQGGSGIIKGLPGFIHGYPDNWGTFDAQANFITPRGIIFSANIEDYDSNDLNKRTGRFTQILLSGQSKDGHLFDVISTFTPDYGPGGIGPGGPAAQEKCEITF